jgi:hypothetical protein
VDRIGKKVNKAHIGECRCGCMSTRRSEPRFPADQPVTVQVTDSNDFLQSNGIITGFSMSGITLQTSSAITPDSDIKITWPRGVVSGQVRYCRKQGPKVFRVGVKITEVVGVGEIPAASRTA